MKTKIRILFFAFLAIISSVSGWGQGKKVVTSSATNVDLSEWLVPHGTVNNNLLQIVLEEVDPSTVKAGANLTITSRTYPDNYNGGGNAPFTLCGASGPYLILASEGRIDYNVNYISWPRLYKQNESLLNQLKLEDNGTILVDGPIELRLPTFFAGSVGANVLFLNNNPIDMSKSSYTLTATGNYELRTDDGTSAPMNVIKFRLEFQATTVAVQSVNVDPTTKTLILGEKFTPTATVNPTTATNQTVSWSSNNSAVATVNTTTGEIEAKSTGTARITVKTQDGNKEATCDVTVNAATVAVQSVNVDPTTKTLIVGEKFTLTATVSPTTATNQTVSWSSNNPAVATVNTTTGEIEAKSAGTATITVKTTDGNKEATCTITVTDVTYALTVNNGTGSGNYASGAIVNIMANAPPANQQFKNWTSSNGGTFANANSASTTFTMPGGATTITANYENITVQSVALNTANKTLSPNETFQLIATITPTNAMNKNITWESDNPAIASVDATGKVTAKAVGNAKVTVTTTDGGKKAECNITVNATNVSVTGITLNKTTLSLAIGASETLVATVTPNDATNKLIEWSTDDVSVLLVENEKVTGLKNGVATLTAKTQDGNFIATCAITVGSGTPPVTVPVTGVSMKPSTALVVGGTETLVPTINPSNATEKTVTWKSCDPTVASIDENGKLTALKAGTTTITATTTDGDFTATCEVTVSNVVVAVISVSLNKSTMELKEGGTETLVPTINPSTATNQTVSWKSSDIAVATVDENGEVVAVKEGTATITVTTADGNKTATCTVTVKKDDVSNDAIDGNSFRAYPNPTDGMITVTGLTTGQQVRIYTLTGTQVAIHTATADGKMEIDLSTLPRGTYILKTITETVKVIRK